MQIIASLVDALHSFIASPPDGDTLDTTFRDLDLAIGSQLLRIQEISENSLISKNIAYASASHDLPLQDYAEMKDFYATFRHAGNIRKTHNGFLLLARAFYKSAALIYEERNDADRLGRIQEAMKQFHFLDDPKEDICKGRHVHLGTGMEYYSITPWKEDAVLAVTNHGKVSAIGPDGPFDVPEIQVNDHLKSIIRTKDRWYFIGECARNVYEFSDDFKEHTTHHPSPEGNPRVQSAHMPNGFALFPYDDSIWLYDQNWTLKKTIRLPQARLASEPYAHDGKVYFRNANSFHQSSELLAIDEHGKIECICDGLDFAPKCSFVGDVCSWPNRSSLYLTIPSRAGYTHLIFPLESLNDLEIGSFAKGYDIVPCNNEYWFFFNMENRTAPEVSTAGMLRINRASMDEMLLEYRK